MGTAEILPEKPWRMDRFEFYHESIKEDGAIWNLPGGKLPGISFCPLKISFRKTEIKDVETAYLLDLWGVQSD